MEKELFSFGILLLSASLLALIAVRFKQATIAGYLLAGVIARFFLAPSPAFNFLSSLGAILLLFFVGLEFSMHKIRSLGKKIFSLGILDLLINFPLGVACGLFFRWNWLEALFLGAVVYVSSSAVISKLLVDAGCMPRKESRIILGILIIEDIIMAIVLAIFSALAYQPVVEYSTIIFTLAKAGLFCLFFILFEQPLRTLMNFILKVELDEIFVLEIIGIIFIVSLVARFIGLSEATGAFFIGSAMAESHHKHRIKSLLEPLGFFAAALFFLSFGLQVDLLSINGHMLIILGVLIAVSILGKMLTAALAMPIEKISWREAQNVGVSLLSRGEFSILVASLIVHNNQAVHGVHEIVAIYVFVLMILSSLFIKRYTTTCRSGLS